MPIKLSSISILLKEDIQEIVLQYNTNKLKDSENLCVLYSPQNICIGFKIQSSSLGKFQSVGQYTKQMRFYGKYLTPYNNYPSFSPEEETLLFNTMCRVLGKEHVNYYKSFSNAITSSPNTNIQFVNIGRSPGTHCTTSPGCGDKMNMSVSHKLSARWLPI